MAASIKQDTEIVKDNVAGVSLETSHDADTAQDKSDEKKSETVKSGVEHEAKSFVDAVKEKAAGAFNFVAGGEGEGKGLVGTVKEKAAEAYHYVAEKVTEATHVVTGDSHTETAKDSNQSDGTNVSVDATNNKAEKKGNEVEVHP